MESLGQGCVTHVLAAQRGPAVMRCICWRLPAVKSWVLQKVTWGESAGIWQLCDRVLKSLALPSSQSQALPCILSPEVRAEEGKGENELINRNELFYRGRASTHPWLAVTPGCLCNLHALCWLQPACLSSVPPALPSPWDLATRPLPGGDGGTGCQRWQPLTSGWLCPLVPSEHR